MNTIKQMLGVALCGATLLSGAVQVNLQPVAFAQLLRWIQALEEQGVRVEAAGLDRAEENRVIARLGLRVVE